MSAAPEEILEFIAERTVVPRPDCQIWFNAVDRGYGRISVDGVVRRVHRVVWELTRGAIPDGLTIDHLCRVRSCVNPDHMELVTRSENSLRGVPFRPRRAPGPLSKCRNGHEYSPENTVIDGRDRRVCITCRRKRYRRRREAA